MPLRLKLLKLQLFHVVGEHLEIDAAVIAAQDADEPAHDVREHGRRQPALEANQCRFVRGRAHIRRQHIQLTGKVGTGVSLIVLQDRQHVAAGSQFLLHCGNKAGQLPLNLLTAFCNHFLCLAALLEVKQYRQQHHDGREQREDQQTRNDRQQRGGRLENGIGQVDLRRHIHAGSTQRAFHAVTLVLVHTDEVRELDSPAKEEGVQRLHSLFLGSPCGQERLLRGETGQLQNIRQNEEQTCGNGHTEKEQ